jgi:hypothetical protein
MINNIKTIVYHQTLAPILLNIVVNNIEVPKVW